MKSEELQWLQDHLMVLHESEAKSAESLADAVMDCILAAPPAYRELLEVQIRQARATRS